MLSSEADVDEPIILLNNSLCRGVVYVYVSNHVASVLSTLVSLLCE